MRSIILYDRNDWAVTSYGNGTAYALELMTPTALLSVFFQGDDAEYFRNNTMGEDGFFVDNVEERFADYLAVMEPVERREL